MHAAFPNSELAPLKESMLKKTEKNKERRKNRREKGGIETSKGNDMKRDEERTAAE